MLMKEETICLSNSKHSRQSSYSNQLQFTWNFSDNILTWALECLLQVLYKYLSSYSRHRKSEIDRKI